MNKIVLTCRRNGEIKIFFLLLWAFFKKMYLNGELAEWLNAAVLKTVIDASLSGVRIPDSPQKADKSAKQMMPREIGVFFYHAVENLFSLGVIKTKKIAKRFWQQLFLRFPPFGISEVNP